MILFYNKKSEIQVVRTRGCGIGIDHIGVLRQPDTGQKSPNWIWDRKNLELDLDKFNYDDRCDIVGMLDKLDDYGHRPNDTKVERWFTIIGKGEQE